MSRFMRNADDTGGSSIHDTDIDGEETTERQAEESSQNLSTDDRDVNRGHSSGHEGNGEDHTVPLRVMLAEREKFQKELAEAAQYKTFYDEKAQFVEKYEAALPEIRELSRHKQIKTREVEELTAEFEALKAAAAAEGVEFDESKFRERRMLEATTRQLHDLPDLMQAQINAALDERDARKHAQEQERNEASRINTASSDFEAALVKAESEYPVLAERRGQFIEAFQRSRGSLTAADVIDPVVDAIRGLSQVQKGQDTAKGITSASAKGKVAKDPSKGDDPFSVGEFETTSEYFKRLKGMKASGTI